MVSQAAATHDTYFRRIDIARKAVAIAMAACGVGVVACVHRDDYLRETLRGGPGIMDVGMLGVSERRCLPNCDLT